MRYHQSESLLPSDYPKLHPCQLWVSERHEILANSSALNLTFCGILYLQRMTATPSCIPHAILEHYHSYLIWTGLRLTCNK